MTHRKGIGMTAISIYEELLKNLLHKGQTLLSLIPRMRLIFQNGEVNISAFILNGAPGVTIHYVMGVVACQSKKGKRNVKHNY